MSEDLTSQNLLIDLCEPYLLDLIRLLAECMRRFEEDVVEIARENRYDFTEEVLSQIEQLDSLQKSEILLEAASQVKAIAERDKQL
ncbi:MAG: hypothetical protein V7K14_30590 [Nostoc sp.]|uniref:hypothetical protein n=1 Tax=Nostoc sp. TaxID=1180 RepID=UPI002FF475D3